MPYLFIFILSLLLVLNIFFQEFTNMLLEVNLVDMLSRFWVGELTMEHLTGKKFLFYFLKFLNNTFTLHVNHLLFNCEPFCL